jgi:thiol-disulfide isomerase/thioredoxin
LLNFVARKVDWAATSFPNPLFTPAVMEGVWATDVLPIKLTVKTHTATDARMLRNMLNTSIDLAITAWRTMVITMKTEDSVLEPSEFLYEISRGYLRTLLPTVEEDKLVFQLPGYGGRFWDFYMMWYGGFIYQMISSIPSFSGFVPDDETFEIGSEFELYGTTMQDKEFDWDSFRGKYVLVKFTSTWCGPCKMELPGMLAAYEKYHSKGLEIVSVYIWEEDGDKGNNTVKKSVQDEAIPWTIISEPLTEKAGKPLLSETFGNGINGVPTMLIVDKEGKVFATDTRGTKLKLVLKQLFEE